MVNRLGLACVLALCVWLAPQGAHAQYKNTVFGLDSGLWLLTKPSILDDDGNVVSGNRRPVRFDYGVRVGGESNFKMNSDRWWFTVRVGVGFFQFGGDESSADLDEQFDAFADSVIGDVLGLEGQMGIRYYLATDLFRPYLQVAISYMRLFSFAGATDDVCIDDLFCSAGALTNEQAFLPTNNIGAAHIQPGVEIILERDIALHLFVDIQRWVRFSAPDNWAPVFGVGINFFS